MKKLILFLTLLQVYSNSNGVTVEEIATNDSGIIYQPTSDKELQAFAQKNPNLTPREEKQIQQILKNPKLRKKLIRHLITNTENPNEQIILRKLLEAIESKKKLANPTQLKQVIYLLIDRLSSLTTIKALTLIIISLVIDRYITKGQRIIESGEITKMLIEIRNILAINFADKSISGILGIIYYFIPLLGR
ncbi:MAG: hypothetical protein ABIA74_01625 [bacterium]